MYTIFSKSHEVFVDSMLSFYPWVKQIPINAYERLFYDWIRPDFSPNNWTAASRLIH